MHKTYQQAVDELSTILDFVRWGMSQFNANQLYYGHGTDNGWDDALTLVLSVLHIPTTFHEPRLLDSALTEDERQHIVALFRQRIEERLPVPYLTNQAFFCGLSFYVDERVLVPRSPVAELIESQFAPWKTPEQVTRILDLCTGSACIAIACAYAFPEAAVDAVDLSGEALEVAQINVEEHQLAEQVALWQSDLYDSLPSDVRYDVIITNPPYVSDEEMATLPEEYSHEPELALRADNEGLALVDRILSQAPNYLSDDGVLILEVGNSEQALCQRYPELPFMWLEFQRGGQGVCLLTAKQLRDHFKHDE